MLSVAPGSEHDIYHLESEGESIGSIAIPVRDHLSAATTSSLLMTDYSWLAQGQSIDRQLIQGGILTLQRNEAVQRMEGDWLVFIDDDMAWRPDAVKRLIQTREELDLDILGALCFRRSPPHQPTLYMREESDRGAYNFLERWESDVIEVDATGMAFVVIHKRVFEAIAGKPMPSKEERKLLGPPNFFRWEGVLGEDLRFCQDAKRAGMRIYVDTRIEVEHASEILIGRRHFLMELAIRDPRLIKDRKSVNDRMGLPTVMPDEALKELRDE